MEVTVLAMEDDGRILVNVVTRYIESTTGKCVVLPSYLFDCTGSRRMTEKSTK